MTIETAIAKLREIKASLDNYFEEINKKEKINFHQIIHATTISNLQTLTEVNELLLDIEQPNSDPKKILKRYIARRTDDLLNGVWRANSTCPLDNAKKHYQYLAICSLLRVLNSKLP